MQTTGWFEADKVGLGKLIAHHGKGRVVAELIQNALDEAPTRIDVTLVPVPGRPLATLIVEDDSPDGFRNLDHAHTLFAESYKVSDPTRMGRFNLGEKLVLALCEEAEIESTTGTVAFNADGTRSRYPRRKRQAGTRFSAVVQMTREELATVEDYVDTILVPDGLVQFNGRVLTARPLLHGFDASLETEVADEDGRLRQRTRLTAVRVYDVRPGETASLYEVAMPVVETGDRWHVAIAQRVPMNFNRDNVPPAFLRRVRSLVLDQMFGRLKGEEVTQRWVQGALADARPEAVDHVLTQQFGDKRVVYDPSDPEANARAVMEGYTVIPSRTFGKEAWANIRAAGAAQPAGRVTPSPKPYSDDPNADPTKILREGQLSDGMRAIRAYAIGLAAALCGQKLTVAFVHTTNGFGACCGPSGRLDFNVFRLGRRFFEAGITEEVDALLLHELAHLNVDDHFSERFHEELCRLGAKLKRVPA
jgi:hypothetical protein